MKLKLIFISTFLILIGCFTGSPNLAGAADGQVLQVGMSGYAANGHEQTEEANNIASKLAQSGLLTDVQGGSSYRNSTYTIEASPNVNFTINGQSLGSVITIVHKQDWLGIATNDCSEFGSGYLEGRIVDDSGCNYVFTSGRSDSTLSAVIINCPAGTTGTYPDCNTTETPPLSCSYDGTVSWGSCSGPFNGTVQDGGSVTVNNTSSGYTGSASFACSNGNWDTTSSSCQRTTTPICPTGTTGVYPNCLRDCSYNGSINWGSGCSGIYDGTVHNGDSVTVNNSASNRDGSASFTCSDGNWNATGSTCSQNFVCSIPLLGSLACPVSTPSSCPSGQTGIPPNCSGGTNGNGGTGGSNCPPGQTGTPPNCSLSSCPKGYIMQNNACVSDGCPSGYTRSSFNGQCERDISRNDDDEPAPVVIPVTITSFTAFPMRTTPSGASSVINLSWQSDNATTCTISGIGAASGKNVGGTKGGRDGNWATPELTEDTRFTLNCSNNNGGSDTKSLTVQILFPKYQEF